MLAKKGLMTAPAAVAQYVEDVFSTYLYKATSNQDAQTINNGIDLSGEGGLVWFKRRSPSTSSTIDHCLIDTVRGNTKYLSSNLTTGNTTRTDTITAFNNNGFTIGGADIINYANDTVASWTFRKAEKFFDVVTYTGNGTDDRAIAHNLGSVPGCYIIKATSTTSDWLVYHRGNPFAPGEGLRLNGTDSTTSLYAPASSSPTTTNFYVGSSGGGTNNNGNINGVTYVAYLFAHDAGGFGDAGDQSVIKCGSYTGNATSGTLITLDWEPQWVLIKRATGTDPGDGWMVIDTMRGMDNNFMQVIKAHASNAEIQEGARVIPRATGFELSSNAAVNASGATYIYIAIRRGPMKTPEVGTSVFDVDTYTGDGGTSRLITTGFAADMSIIRDRNSGTDAYRYNFTQDRLRGGGNSLVTSETGGEGYDTGWDNNDMRDQFRSNTGILVTIKLSRYNANSASYVTYNFARAPGFFDVVNVKTNQQASAITSSHNLGAVPEMMIAKKRGPTGGAGDWMVYHKDLNGGTTPQNYRIRLNNTGGEAASSGYWNNTAPTSTQFTIGTDSDINSGSAGDSTIVYLFGSVSGVSKVGSYVGTGTTLQVNCGFTSGARFVLIKRRDDSAAGDWYVWDSARGIVSGNDPYLLLNSTATEVTSTDYIDTYSSGFEISSTAPAAINANGGNFIFLAIA